MRKLLTWLLWPGILLSFVMTDAWGAVQYNVTDLGTLGGDASWATGINDSGQVVGFSTDTSENVGAFLYTGSGAMQDLGNLGGGVLSQAEGINNSGQVVGLSVISYTNGHMLYHAFLWTGSGTMRDLGALDMANNSAANDINNRGQIVGYSYCTTSNSPHAFIFSSGGPMIDLGTLSGTSSDARSINDSGHVVGSSDLGRGIYHAFLWQSSTGMQDLGAPGGVVSRADCINNKGQIVGQIGFASGIAHAFFYNGSGPMTDLGSLGGPSSEALSINDTGVIVGSSYTTSASISRHAFVYRNSVMTDLNTLIDQTSGWLLQSATAINEAGQIVGDGVIGGQAHAFLLTAVPEPATLVLFGMAAISLLACARRRRR